jgi:uncharacterized protein YceK
MFYILLMLFLMILIGGAATVIALSTAPEGYEDSEGFHLNEANESFDALQAQREKTAANSAYELILDAMATPADENHGTGATPRRL